MSFTSKPHRVAGNFLAAALAFTIITGFARSPAPTGDPRNTTAHPGDSAAVLAAVSGYHSALERGDSAKAIGLLTNDAIILESGDVESRAEYRSHHLSSDMKFAQAIRDTRVIRRVTVVGDAAWVASSSTTKGEFSGRPIDSMGAELMVLVRTKAGWKISAIHWSSRRRSPAP